MGFGVILSNPWFLPRDALQCKARSCYHMSSVRPSVCPSVCDVGGSWRHRWKIL